MLHTEAGAAENAKSKKISNLNYFGTKMFPML